MGLLNTRRFGQTLARVGISLGAIGAFVAGLLVLTLGTASANYITASPSSNCDGWTYSAKYNSGGSSQNASYNRLVIVDVSIGGSVIKEYHYFDTLTSHPAPAAGFTVVDHPVTNSFTLFALSGSTFPVTTSGSIKVYDGSSSSSPSSDPAYDHLLPSYSLLTIPGITTPGGCATATHTPTNTRTATATATATRTSTPVAPSTHTATATTTRTATSTHTATKTATSIPLTATKTPECEDGSVGARDSNNEDQKCDPFRPTNTPVPPTKTPTHTPVPPTNTPTRTPVPPTNTPTHTPVPPTATNTPECGEGSVDVRDSDDEDQKCDPFTPTHTPVPPTVTPTHTPVPPTNTPTHTPVPPTATNTPECGDGSVDEKGSEGNGQQCAPFTPTVTHTATPTATNTSTPAHTATSTAPATATNTATATATPAVTTNNRSVTNTTVPSTSTAVPPAATQTPRANVLGVQAAPPPRIAEALPDTGDGSASRAGVRLMLAILLCAGTGALILMAMKLRRDLK